MSTGIGTLQAPGQSRWPAIAMALLVVAIVAVVAAIVPATIDQPDGRSGGRPLVNTLSEVSAGVGAGFVGGTANNTPSEFSIGGKSGPHGHLTYPRPANIGSIGEWPRTADAIAAAAAAERYDRHQRR
jgi:hypothetical protein